jgi:hypothetical protein
MKIDTQAQKTDYQAPLPSGGVGGGLLGAGSVGSAGSFFSFPFYTHARAKGLTLAAKSGDFPEREVSHCGWKNAKL